jgi:hypothetical protein
VENTLIEIDCDGCGEEIQIILAANSNDETETETEAVEEKLSAEGWLVKEDEVYCPACAPMYTDKEGN